MLKKIFDGKTILYLSLISPFIDIITSVMVMNNINITLGMFLKTIILFLVVINLLLIDKKKRKYNYIIVGIIFIHNILNLVNNVSKIDSQYLFSSISYLVKFDFNVLLLYFFSKYFKEYKLDIKLLKIPIIIISSSIILSNLTNTAFYTYDMYRAGTSSWFSSGNEFGAILSILYPISIYLFADRKDSKKIELIYIIILGYGMLEIGSKVGLLAFYISSISYLIFRMFNLKKYKLNYSFYSILLMVIISVCLFNHLPTTKNVKNKYNYETEILTEKYPDKDVELLAAGNVLLSNRDQYFLYVKNNNYDLIDYLVGKINTKDSEIIMIEMDLFDIFYTFGAIGFLILYGIIIYIAIKTLIKYYKNIKNGIRYIKINMLIICISQTFLISCIVGHVMLCPSVSIFFALLCAYIFNYKEFVKKEEKRIEILIGSVHAKIGGIETTLINLLKQLDYNKYNVELLLQLETGELYEKIPKKVKIITPYNKIFSNFFAKESKLSKLVKHALYNKYTAWLLTNNKHYDIAIDYSGYYLFIDHYIANTSSNKSLIWVHQNVEGSKEFDKNFNKRFMKNKNKYKKYDKIVCVSKSAKDSFDRMLPRFCNKTTVVNNLIDSNIQYKTKQNLPGKYKIITVGRMCPQKAFTRLVDIHKNLIDKGYDIHTYIIGDGEEFSQIKEKIKENNVEKSITLLGKKNGVYDYLKECDLFISTSKTEAFPTVLFESLICQVPWVGPNNRGVKDIYELSPPGSCILTEDTTEDLTKGVIEAIEGKVTKNFKFDIDNYNKKTLKQFYKVIGD